MISQRTIAGPATAKARGRKLGSSDSASPLSSRALAADTRAAAGAAFRSSALTLPPAFCWSNASRCRRCSTAFRVGCLRSFHRRIKH
jgi:hypothetical protein